VYPIALTPTSDSPESFASDFCKHMGSIIPAVSSTAAQRVRSARGAPASSISGGRHSPRHIRYTVQIEKVSAPMAKLIIHVLPTPNVAAHSPSNEQVSPMPVSAHRFPSSANECAAMSVVSTIAVVAGPMPVPAAMPAARVSTPIPMMFFVSDAVEPSKPVTRDVCSTTAEALPPRSRPSKGSDAALPSMGMKHFGREIIKVWLSQVEKVSQSRGKSKSVS
jgi:hypothetical protein